jgi:hypothetical protein
LGIKAARRAISSQGSKRIARVPSCHGRRSRRRIFPSPVSARARLERPADAARIGRAAPDAPGRPAGTATPAWRSKPPKWACRSASAACSVASDFRPTRNDHLAGTTTRRDPAEDRGTRDPREQRRLGRKAIDPVFRLRPLEVDPVALGEPRDPPRGREQERFHLGFGRLGIRQAPAAVVDEHALHGQGVEVHVQVERRPEPLDRGHRPTAPTPDAVTSGSAALEAEQSADDRVASRFHARASRARTVPAKERSVERPLPVAERSRLSGSGL